MLADPAAAGVDSAVALLAQLPDLAAAAVDSAAALPAQVPPDLVVAVVDSAAALLVPDRVVHLLSRRSFSAAMARSTT